MHTWCLYISTECSAESYLPIVLLSVQSSVMFTISFSGPTLPTTSGDSSASPWQQGKAVKLCGVDFLCAVYTIKSF